MQHSLKMVEHKEVNDENVSFCFRCCDDPATDSWCTVSLHLSDADVTEAVNGHKGRIAGNHEHKHNFRKGTHPALAAAADATITL